MDETDKKQMSDLARAILSGERITSSTGIDKNVVQAMSGNTGIPEGAVSITEGAKLVCNSRTDSKKAAVDGGVPVRFSLDDDEKE